MLRRADMLAAIEKRGDLDGRSVNLFRNALKRETPVGSASALIEPLVSQRDHQI